MDLGQCGAYICCHFVEAAVAKVPEQVCRLRVGDLRLHLLDVVGNVTIYCKDVWASVEVVVEEEATEGQG